MPDTRTDGRSEAYSESSQAGKESAEQPEIVNSPSETRSQQISRCLTDAHTVWSTAMSGKKLQKYLSAYPFVKSDYLSMGETLTEASDLMSPSEPASEAQLEDVHSRFKEREYALFETIDKMPLAAAPSNSLVRYQGCTCTTGLMSKSARRKNRLREIEERRGKREVIVTKTSDKPSVQGNVLESWEDFEG